jgi:signal transduction histidine kinase
MLEDMQTSCSFMLGLINNVLDYSKLQAEELEATYAPFNLHQPLTEITKMFAAWVNSQKFSCDF